MKPKADWKRLAEIVKRNADAIGQCETFVVIMNRNIAEDVMPVLQMGIAVYQDKPVVILVRESDRGSVPENLKRLATAIEYYDDGAENPSMEMQAATMRLMAKAGMVVR